MAVAKTWIATILQPMCLLLSSDVKDLCRWHDLWYEQDDVVDKPVPTNIIIWNLLLEMNAHLRNSCYNVNVILLLISYESTYSTPLKQYLPLIFILFSRISLQKYK